MIWVLGITLSLVLALYLSAPFLAAETKATNDAEVQTYKDELRALQSHEDSDPTKIALLQAQLLKAAKAEDPKSGSRSLGLASGICLSLIGATLGLYNYLGSPNFTPETRQPPPEVAETPATDFAALLPRFEARLAENPADAEGWKLYGRTLMLAGDTEAGLRAYEKALELTDTPDIRKEFEAAQRFADQVKAGPDAETIASMQNLSEAERTAAIEAMVNSLRARLDTDPNDVQGWARLLRSRKVLGQTEAAKEDIETLRRVFPDQADAIIAESGWEN